jgi:hypothetical protein
MAEHEFEGVIRYLEETPGIIRRMAAELLERELRWKPEAEEFSLLEQVCHLRDLETEGYAARIKRMLAEDEPALADFDGARISRERDYNKQDFEQAIRDFSQARAENVRVARSLSPEQLNRRGLLEGAGSITLKKLFLLMREHDRSHRAELTNLRERRAATIGEKPGAGIQESESKESGDSGSAPLLS